MFGKSHAIPKVGEDWDIYNQSQTAARSMLGKSLKNPYSGNPWDFVHFKSTLNYGGFAMITPLS